MTNKTESISNDFEKRITTLLGKEKSKLEILQQNMTLLQNELLSKNEIIKSLIEIQSLEQGEEIDFSCVCVAETVFLTLLLQLLLSTLYS